jgi:hypothetical protein
MQQGPTAFPSLRWIKHPDPYGDNALRQFLWAALANPHGGEAAILTGYAFGDGTLAVIDCHGTIMEFTFAASMQLSRDQGGACSMRTAHFLILPLSGVPSYVDGTAVQIVGADSGMNCSWCSTHLCCQESVGLGGCSPSSPHELIVQLDEHLQAALMTCVELLEGRRTAGPLPLTAAISRVLTSLLVWAAALGSGKTCAQKLPDGRRRAHALKRH